ncbi:MAG TPA: hypothetical protein GX498_09150 [Clostridiales bacterium]|nr:hypothetical protein [Clostridiales bacterium]
MDYKIEEVLKNLIRIDDIATKMDEKRQIEIDVIEDEYKAEIEKLKKRLEEEKLNAEKYIREVTERARKEADVIEKEKQAVLKDLDNKYREAKKDILSKTISKIFGVEMGSKWMP